MSSTSPIKVVKPTPEQVATVKRSWPTWGCGVSKFPWTYGETEKALILKGKVIVTPTGGSPVEINAGDFCEFEAGLSCEWDVKEELLKHYNFE